MKDTQNRLMMNEPDTAEEKSLPELLMQTDRLLQRYHMACRPQPGCIDPRRGQGRILALLKKAPEISQRELGYLLDIRQQSLAELLMKLEAAGYITRSASETDRRVMNIKLTDKGREAELKAVDFSDAFSCLNEEEQQQMREYLSRVSNQLEQQVGVMDGQRRPGRGPRGGMMPPPPHGEFGGHGPHGGMMPPPPHGEFGGHGPHGGMMPPPPHGEFGGHGPQGGMMPPPPHGEFGGHGPHGGMMPPPPHGEFGGHGPQGGMMPPHGEFGGCGPRTEPDFFADKQNDDDTPDDPGVKA